MYALEYGVIDLREYIGIGTRNQQRGTLLSRLKSRVSAAPAPRGCHEELIAHVNTWLIDILGEPGSLTVDRITRVTEEIQDGVKEPGFVCVWID